MDGVIVFILIVLLLWEFLVWRGFTRARKDMILLRGAIARYIHRREELLTVLQEHSSRHSLPELEVPGGLPQIPPEGLTLQELQTVIYENRTVEYVVKERVHLPPWQARIQHDEELFYTVDEFLELQTVIHQCIQRYNETYDAFNKKATTLPTAVVAKVFRIKSLTSGYLEP